MSAHLIQYLKYMRATGQSSVPNDWFDDDHEPIGPTLRQDLVHAGYVIDNGASLTMTEAGEAALRST